MSYDAECPHCKEDFTPDDLHESGRYSCPYCLKEIWIDVEYEVTYEASCSPDDHKWLPLKLDPNYQQCETCGKLKRTESEGDK